MKVTHTDLPEVLLVEPLIFADGRGYFGEVFSARRYAALGIDGPFAQDNVTFSRNGVLRGLHFQHPNGQGKLVYVLRGEVFDVAVDVRVQSARFGRWASAVLSAANHAQIFIPAGFAHGFVVTSTDAIVAYKCTDYYAPQSEQSIRWDDPDIGIAWPVAAPQLSARDESAPLLREIPRDRLPPYG